MRKLVRLGEYSVTVAANLPERYEYKSNVRATFDAEKFQNNVYIGYMQGLYSDCKVDFVKKI